MTAEEVVKRLGLEPLQPEGGYFAETYRAARHIEAAPGRHRALATSIYYLVTPDTFSAMHRVLSDEIFHFYLGDPIEMLQLWPDGLGKVVTLGPDVLHGQQPQIVVPKGVWQGSRLAPGGEFCRWARRFHLASSLPITKGEAERP